MPHRLYWFGIWRKWVKQLGTTNFMLIWFSQDQHGGPLNIKLKAKAKKMCGDICGQAWASLIPGYQRRKHLLTWFMFPVYMKTKMMEQKATNPQGAPRHTVTFETRQNHLLGSVWGGVLLSRGGPKHTYKGAAAQEDFRLVRSDVKLDDVSVPVPVNQLRI